MQSGDKRPCAAAFRQSAETPGRGGFGAAAAAIERLRFRQFGRTGLGRATIGVGGQWLCIARHFFRRHIETGILHAQRREQTGFQIIAQALAGELFQQSGDVEAKAIIPSRAGLPQQGQAGQSVEELIAGHVAVTAAARIHFVNDGITAAAIIRPERMPQQILGMAMARRAGSV